MAYSVHRRFHRVAGMVAATSLAILSFTGIFLNHPVSSEHKHPLSDPHVVTFIPSEPGYMMVADDNGLYLSKDNGATFDVLPLMYPANDIRHIVIENGLYLVFEKGVILFSKSMEPFIWDRIHLPDGFGSIIGFSVGSDAQFALDTDSGVFLSKDNGNNWILLQTRAISFQSLMKALHTGYFWGTWLKWFHDIGAILLLGLIGSGIYMYRRSKPR